MGHFTKLRKYGTRRWTRSLAGIALAGAAGIYLFSAAAYAEERVRRRLPDLEDLAAERRARQPSRDLEERLQRRRIVLPESDAKELERAVTASSTRHYPARCLQSCNPETSRMYQTHFDPFVPALRAVLESRRGCWKRRWHYGAYREREDKDGSIKPGVHDGIDLFVPMDTPVQIPAERVVLMGVCRDDPPFYGKKDKRGRYVPLPGSEALGNAVTYFVPDDEKPYFLLLAHLSRRTLELLDEFDIGREFVAAPGISVPVAYTGNSRSGICPHLHFTVANELWDFWHKGKREFTAEEFMRMYHDGTLSAFLEESNMYTVVTPARHRNRQSLDGSINPVQLIREGRLRISNYPERPEEAARAREARYARRR